MAQSLPRGHNPTRSIFPHKAALFRQRARNTLQNRIAKGASIGHCPRSEHHVTTPTQRSPAVFPRSEKGAHSVAFSFGVGAHHHRERQPNVLVATHNLTPSEPRHCTGPRYRRLSPHIEMSSSAAQGAQPARHLRTLTQRAPLEHSSHLSLSIRRLRKHTSRPGHRAEQRRQGPVLVVGPAARNPFSFCRLPLSSDKALSAKTGPSPATPCLNGVGSKAVALDWSARIKMGAPDSIARALAHGGPCFDLPLSLPSFSSLLL